ncbi:MAG: sugar-binding transcriptional regulator [Geminicoccaceae bacterium]
MGEAVGPGDKRRDEAARAAWLYFIGGCTQDEIARQMDVSRQAAQRLVSFAVSEKLIKFRMEHPIASCMDFAKRIADRYRLEFCDVTPSTVNAGGSVAGVAVATAIRLNRLLTAKTPTIIGVGTGRTLRAAVDEIDYLDRPQHKIVSLVGNMATDGRASPYEVAMRLADKIGAQRFPMPAPVLAETAEEREALRNQKYFGMLRELRGQARASFVGIAEVGWQSPLHQDGFVTDADVSALLDSGAVGEIIGWPFDASGRPVDTPIYERGASLELEVPPQRLTVIVGCGPQKTLPLKAALTGGLASALITDVTTAGALLEE